MTGRGLVLPRFGTPRNPDLPTRGGEYTEVCRRLGFEPMPWQQYVADVALEYNPDLDDRLEYDESDGSVMRQCGKTVGLLFPQMVRRMTIVPHRLGRQRCTFTMQKRDNARRKLERDFAEILRATDQFNEIRNPKARPSRSTKQWKLGLNNGSEHLLFGQGNYLQIDTPSKQAGHGDTLDLGVMDEIRFYLDDRVEQAMRPAQSTRREAQIWAWSTAGDEESYYLWSKVVAGRRTVTQNLKSRVCYFEWSIPEEADLHDPDVWWEFHPALGWTIELDFIMAELERAERNPDDTALDTFRQEYANQWVRHPIIGEEARAAIIDPGIWAQRAVAPSTEFLKPRVLGVQVADSGRSASIVLVGWNAGGYGQVKVLRRDPGTFWVEAALAELVAEHEVAVVTYDAGGPTNSIAGAIARAAGRADVEPLNGRAYSSACEAFVSGFVEGRYRHMDQEWLNDALDGARKKQRGESWLWDLQSSLADITPLPAATCALRALEGRPPKRRSVYEDRGLITVGGAS